MSSEGYPGLVWVSFFFSFLLRSLSLVLGILWRVIFFFFLIVLWVPSQTLKSLQRNVFQGEMVLSKFSFLFSRFGFGKPDRRFLLLFKI